jgi:surface protein
MQTKALFLSLILLVLWSCDPNEPDSIYVNTAPVIKDYTFNVMEDIPDGQVIGKLSATDANNDHLIFSVYEDESGLFAISEKGDLKLASGMSLDYETINEYNLTIRVYDGIVGRYSAVKIIVENVKEFTIGPNSWEALENITDNHIIGVLGVNDPDDGTYTFSISSNDNDLFEITEKGELSLAPGKTLDYEIDTEHLITVEAQGTSQLIAEEIAIKVINVAELDDPTSFLTTWKVDADGQSITIGTNLDYTYDFAINWGDGTLENLTSDKPSHVYDVAGTYTVAIQGNFPAIQMENTDGLSKQALVSIDQWGVINWQSMHHAFYECGNMTYNAADNPNLSEVQSMSGMFYSATSFNADLDEWDVSNVSDMSQLFFNANAFNGAIGSWDVSNVTDMSEMFFGANIFNQDIGNWDVGNVKTLEGMLAFTPFNQYIGNWNVSSVENMSGVFGNASIFNQNIADWDVSNVTNMSAMFSQATSFNQNIGNWDVANVTDMSFMFFNANAFNQDISNWKTSNVTNMIYAFNGADSFNQNMNGMLSSAISFNQSLTSWNIGSVTKMASMLSNCGMSTDNFNATILAWHTYAKDHNGPTGIALGATGLVACGIDVYTAAFSLDVDFGWEITGVTFLENCN